MRVVKLPANQCWVLLAGDTVDAPLVRLEPTDAGPRLPYLWPSRAELVRELARHGLAVAPNGEVMAKKSSSEVKIPLDRTSGQA